MEVGHDRAIAKGSEVLEATVSLSIIDGLGGGFL
jgi:hypothetical protein